MPPRFMPSGLLHCDAAKAMPGFTLFCPMAHPEVFVVNMKGEKVHKWTLPGEPGVYAHLLENGNLLVAVSTDTAPYDLPAGGGRIMELDWDGNTVWEHVDPLQHHDFRRLKNGNTVYLAWKLLNKETEARVKGGMPGSEHPDGIYGDVIREVSPDGKTVWDWNVEDHFDIESYALHPAAWRREYAHANTIAPTASGDFIINQRMSGFMGIIDKSTKKVRWGMQEPEFGQQHDVQELPNGHLLFFANGATGASFSGPEAGSQVIELDPKTNEIVWRYRSMPHHFFFSWYISGCQRLDNGNTLICEGVWGRLFEVTPDGEIVWEYVNPEIEGGADNPHMVGRSIFRCYRYSADSPQIQGRLGAP